MLQTLKKTASFFINKTFNPLKTIFLRVWFLNLVLVKKWSANLKRQNALFRMRKADIVLASPRTTRLSLTALLYRIFLRSRYIHSMLYIGDGKIIHTTARHGVVVGRVPKKIYKKNQYTIFRVKNMDAEKRDQIVAEALKLEGKKLDHAGLITTVPSRLLGLRKALISMEKNRIWCSRLIYQAFHSADIELVPPEKADVITSEDLAHTPYVMKI